MPQVKTFWKIFNLLNESVPVTSNYVKDRTTFLHNNGWTRKQFELECEHHRAEITEQASKQAADILNRLHS